MHTTIRRRNGMKRLLLCLLIVFLFVPALFYATGGKEEAEETKKLTKIGYSPLSTQLEYFQRVILGMQRKCDENGIKLLIDDPQLDLNKQVTGLENLLTAGAQSLVICCLDPVAVEAAVDEAHAKGVSVISHVSTFKGADVYVGLNEYEFGFAGGETFALEFKKVHSGKAYVANLDANTLGEGLVQRNNGLIDGFKKHFPNAEVVAQSTAFDEAKALEVFESMLQAHPNINVMLPNNDPAAYGVIDAVEGAGLGVNKDVYIGCVGDQFKTLDLIEEGKIFSSVSVSPERTGEIMVEVAIDIFNGKDVPHDVYIPHKPITKSNVREVRDYKLSFGPME
jgi:ribose transport system substrate-binding protein